MVRIAVPSLDFQSPSDGNRRRPPPLLRHSLVGDHPRPAARCRNADNRAGETASPRQEHRQLLPFGVPDGSAAALAPASARRTFAAPIARGRRASGGRLASRGEAAAGAPKLTRTPPHVGHPHLFFDVGSKSVFGGTFRRGSIPSTTLRLAAKAGLCGAPGRAFRFAPLHEALNGPLQGRPIEKLARDT